MSNENQTLYVMGHLDLGDSIVMNGLIRNLLTNWGSVCWFVKPEYVEAIASMMADCNRLKVLPAEKGYEDPSASWIPSYLNILRLGFFHKGSFDQLHWDYEFYRQANIYFDARWSNFRHAQISQFIPSVNSDKIIIHERAENDWRVNGGLLPDGGDLVYIKKVEDKSPWDWIPEIYTAKEVHVIDSAFLCLADSLPFFGPDSTPANRLVFHSYAKQYPGPARWPALGKRWEILT